MSEARWFSEQIGPDVAPDRPGLYEWRIEGVGCYIGQYSRVSRPRRSYDVTVRRLLAGKPYRQGNPDGFRVIHHELARAKAAGRLVTLSLLENVAAKPARNRRERELIAARHAAAAEGGLPVLNR